MTSPEGVRWRPGTNTAGSRQTDAEGVTGRGLNEYGDIFVDTIMDKARGNRVLDWGAGKNAAFGRSLVKALEGNVEVHSLSPEYTDEDLERLKEFHAARGFAQNLPYEDNYFKYIAGNQVHKHFPDRAHYLQALAELSRVLDYGGVAHLGPALPDDEAHRLISEGKTSPEWKNKRNESPKKVEHDTEHWVFLYDDAPPTPEERKQYGIPDTVRITKKSKIHAVARGVLGVKTNVILEKAAAEESATT